MVFREMTHSRQGSQWLTVNQASERYGVGRRCIRKWLEKGKLSGRRAGKRWYVLAPDRSESGSESGKPNSEKVSNNGRLPPPLPTRPIPPANTPAASGRDGDEGKYHVQSLGAWQSCVPVLACCVARIDDADSLKRRLAERTVRLFEALARGYHSFHYRDKVAHYLEARGALCDVVAIADLLGERELSVAVQEAPLSSITALIRAMEKKGGRGGDRTARGTEDRARRL